MDPLHRVFPCLELLDAQSPLSDAIATDINTYIEEALMIMVNHSFSSFTDCSEKIWLCVSWLMTYMLHKFTITTPGNLLHLLIIWDECPLLFPVFPPLSLPFLLEQTDTYKRSWTVLQVYG